MVGSRSSQLEALLARPFVQRAYSLSLAMGLTTILATINLCPPKCSKSRILITKEIGRLGTFVATLPRSGVKAPRVQAGEAWDSLSLWKYAIQAASQEMTARRAGKP
jgi:hypothetical protein